MAGNDLKYHKKVYDQLFPQIDDGHQISLAVKWHILTQRRLEGYTIFYWIFGISQTDRQTDSYG